MEFPVLLKQGRLLQAPLKNSREVILIQVLKHTHASHLQQYNPLTLDPIIDPRPNSWLKNATS